MLAGKKRSSDVETVAEGQHEGDNDLCVQRQLHQADASGHGEEAEEEPDVPADGRRVDAQPRPLVSASAKGERRDPDDEHGEGREHQRCPEYRSYTNRGPFFRGFTCEDRLEDGDYGDHALRQGSAHGGEQASHGPLAHPEASSQYLYRVRKKTAPPMIATSATTNSITVDKTHLLSDG